ncbi:MAG: iron-siderophore transporter permease protein [Amycolatopsis sp.]|uniref:FecCD family ABC transporter permease n=1 Tax=Amycolatopsis sp. TaxID=37632 RepID=UPI0026110E0E|nr:iron chelate uptake ABC transporter family permease subunit [Amycolatopsis sp.]MCU1686970.1 iron-siderophore transporter permease protein [Amycolatopsis sp.]
MLVPVARRRHGLRTVTGVLVLVALLVGLLFASLALGSQTLPLGQVWHAVFAPDGSAASIIVWKLRFPRTVLAVVVGADLAVAGVVMQSLTRNRLAEPGLLGVNSGAALAVVLGISVFGVSSAAGYVWFAFAGAGASAIVVQLVGRGGGSDRVRLVLAGAALSASLSAATGIITLFDSNTFDSYRFWVVGALADRGLDVLVAVLPFSLVALALAAVMSRSLNALALGDELGVSLGVRLAWARGLAFAAVILASGAATAAAGPVAFVGLAVPQVLRWRVGPDVRALVPHALLAGPVLLLASDLIGRLVAPPGELELGIVTAFVGAPFLLAAVLRRRSAR